MGIKAGVENLLQHQVNMTALTVYATICDKRVANPHKTHRVRPHPMRSVFPV